MSKEQPFESRVGIKKIRIWLGEGERDIPNSLAILRRSRYTDCPAERDPFGTMTVLWCTLQLKKRKIVCIFKDVAGFARSERVRLMPNSCVTKSASV